MILLYTFALFLFGAVHWVIQRRAIALGRTYSQRAEAVLKLVSTPVWKLGNSAKHDPCASAKHQYELGQLALQRDRAEVKYYKAQHAADRLGRWLAAAKAWKGKKLPYTLGVCDVWLVLYVIDRLGVGDYVGPRQVIDAVTTWLTQ
jgi:hypothetical protein